MYCLGMYWKLIVLSHMWAFWPGFSVKYGVPDAAQAPLIGGSSVRYRPGLFIWPPPMVTAKRSLWNHMRLYSIHPRNDDLFGPPRQVIPPPYWHPASPVRENAIFEIPRFSGLL